MDKLNDLLKEYSQDITVGDLDSLKVLRGFIKRLVDNDKIDTDIVYKKWFLARTYDKDEVWEYFEPYEEILMLLAIQDEPINFLISILK